MKLSTVIVLFFVLCDVVLWRHAHRFWRNMQVIHLLWLFLW